MAKIVFGMNLSLDGYVDHDRFAPDPGLFRHWIEYVESLTGSIYGSRLYQIMRYWDEDQPDWGPEEQAFAIAWRTHPKWVVSRSLASVGPNASLISGNAETTIRDLKEQLPGELDVGGTKLAQSLGAAGLIDEYRLYFHPVVLGKGTPFFAGPLPRLRLVKNESLGESVVRLTYAPT